MEKKPETLERSMTTVITTSAYSYNSRVAATFFSEAAVTQMPEYSYMFAYLPV